MIDDVLTKTVITVRERRQEENESKPWRAKKEKKKEKSRKKTGAQKTSSFSHFETTNFDTKQHISARASLSLATKTRTIEKESVFTRFAAEI
jgi:hypothetical protein